MSDNQFKDEFKSLMQYNPDWSEQQVHLCYIGFKTPMGQMAVALAAAIGQSFV